MIRCCYSKSATYTVSTNPRSSCEFPQANLLEGLIKILSNQSNQNTAVTQGGRKVKSLQNISVEHHSHVG